MIKENDVVINKAMFGNLPVSVFKQLMVLLCFMSLSFTAICQEKNTDYKFGNVTAKDFDVSSSKIVDSGVAAVILYEAGSTHFIGNNSSWFDYVYTCTRRIKILNKKAFNLATIRLGLYIDDQDENDLDNKDVLSDIKAVTYNIDNGVISSTQLDKNDIFSEKEDKNFIVEKFTLPAVKEGSIIEYTYTLTSPYIFNIPSWKFQHADYPVLWSEYQVSIPTVLTYASIKQGIDSFYVNKAWEEKETYKMNNKNPDENSYTISRQLFAEVNTLMHRWVQKDVMPFKVESYISSPENYIDKIEFQLSGTYNSEEKSAIWHTWRPYNGEQRSEVWNTWQTASKEFFNEDDFQKAVAHDNAWIKDVRGSANPQNNLDVAKEIYYYLQNNYTCTDTSDALRSTDLYDVYRKQKGSVRGVNLLLTAMLNNKGIYAQPVMLSTKENGFLNPDYPVRNKFDYLICKATIDGQVYLLDATDASLGFGKLPLKCFNGYARVIDASQSDSLYLLSDSLKETTVSTLFLSNDDNGQVSGAYKTTLGEFQSRNIRKTLAATNKDDYFKRFGKAYSFDVNISNAAIDSLDQKEVPISMRYNLSFKPEGDVFYFNPITSAGDDMITENPFKAAQRSYPVEMSFTQDKTYIFSMQVPAGYKVDELPKSARVTLNDNQGSFEYLIQQSNDQIQMRYHLKLNKATFEPEDYESLRNFFAFIVEKESEQIVFKKQ